jgi:GNAT superfamily N-acetyltransferase
MMRELKKADATDIDRVFSLFSSVIADAQAHGGSHWSDDYPTRDIVLDDLENHHVFILLDDGKIIAAITLVPGPNPLDDRTDWKYDAPCELDRLCVDPAYRGRGVGRYMMDMISGYAKSLGFGSTRHYASKVNAAANALYAGMQYRNAGEVELYELQFIAYEKKL